MSFSSTHSKDGISFLSSFLLQLSRLPYYLLLLALVLLPLIYDTGQAWWLPLLTLHLTITFVCWALPHWWHGRRLPQLRFTPALALFLVPLLFSLPQLIPNLSGLSVLSPRVCELWSRFNAIALVPASPTLSLAPDATVERIILFSCCGVFLFLLTNCTRSSFQLKGLLFAISCSALGNAILAYISLAQPLTNPAAGINGAFLNRNHFAFLMLLGIMSTLTLLALQSFSKAPRDNDLLGQRRHSYHRILPLLLILFTLLTAQVISLSRGAFMASVSAILLFAIAWFKSPRTIRRRRRQVILAYSVLLTLALAFALYFSLSRLSARYEVLTKQDFTMNARWLVWKDSLKLILDNWQCGVGQGAFPYAIQMYESGNFTEHIIGHAHNDVLEFAAETGLPATVILFAVVLVLLGVSWRRAWHWQEPIRRWAALGALITLLACLIHELVEFNLQAWSNLLVFTSVIGVASVALSSDGSSRTAAPHPRRQPDALHEHRRKRLTTRLPLLLASLVALALLPAEFRYLQAGRAYASLTQDLQLGYHTFKPNHIDYARRTKLIQQASHPLLNRHFLHQQSALIHAALAEHTSSRHKIKLLRETSHFMALAAMRMPTHGETAYMNAHFQDLASLLSAVTLQPRQVELLYDWALACQPNMVPMLQKTGMKAFHNFLDAYGQDDPSVLNHHKQRAREILLRGLTLSPANEEIFNALFYLFGNTPELLKVAPNNYVTMSTLANLLIKKKQPENALKLAKHILKQHASELSRKQLIDTYSVIASVQCILRQEEDRKGTWAKLWSTVRARADEEDGEIMSSLSSTHPRNALSKLKRHESTDFCSSDHLVSKAHLFSLLGRQTDAVVALLPLTYQFYVPPASSVIDRALAILRGNRLPADSFFATRDAFLRQALVILKAEQTGHHDELGSAIRQLEALQSQQAKQKRPWLNSHLIPLYLGKAYSLLHLDKQAALALRQSLQLCPRNVYAMSFLQRFRPQSLTSEEQALLSSLHANQLPIAHFHSGLTWFATSFSQATITERHQKQSVTYFFSCHNDILQPISLNMIYEDQEGVAFMDPIRFKNGEEMTFRIGELIAVRHDWQPYVKALTHANRLLSDGAVTVKASAKALPPPYSWAFQVKLSQ